MKIKFRDLSWGLKIPIITGWVATINYLIILAFMWGFL